MVFFGLLYKKKPRQDTQVRDRGSSGCPQGGHREEPPSFTVPQSLPVPCWCSEVGAPSTPLQLAATAIQIKPLIKINAVGFQLDQNENWES